jgi:hypothetical protein
MLEDGRADDAGEVAVEGRRPRVADDVDADAGALIDADVDIATDVVARRAVDVERTEFQNAPGCPAMSERTLAMIEPLTIRTVPGDDDRRP